MSTADAKAYIETLERLGFLGPTPALGGSFDPHNLLASISPATGWKWAGSNSATGSRPAGCLGPWDRAVQACGATALEAREYASDADQRASWRQFSWEPTEGVDVFRDKATGEIMYVGRTQKGAPPAHLSSAMVQERFSSLADELKRWGAFENAAAGDYRGDLASLYQRAKQLVVDTQEGEPGPLQLQGVAARLLEQWEEQRCCSVG